MIQGARCCGKLGPNFYYEHTIAVPENRANKRGLCKKLKGEIHIRTLWPRLY